MKALIVLCSILALCHGKFVQVGEPRPFINATNALRLKSSAAAPSLRCYDAPNQSGYYITIGSEAVSDLSRSPYNFDNRIASCTFNGIYFMYDDYNFNKNNFQAPVYAETWGENYKVNMNDFAYKASSVRWTSQDDILVALFSHHAHPSCIFWTPPL